MCVYTIYAKTEKAAHGGTDANISLRLRNKFGDSFYIENLVSWGGLMEEDGHQYFAKGNIDIFSGRGSCLNSPVCGIEVTSDNTGDFPRWYLEYVEVTTAGPHLTAESVQFKVEQWLAADEPPFKLTARKDSCPNSFQDRALAI